MKSFLTVSVIMSFVSSSVWAITDEEANAMRAEIAELRAQVTELQTVLERMAALESRVGSLPAIRQRSVATERLDILEEYPSSNERDKVAGVDRHEKEREEQEVDLDLGGALWINYAYQDFKTPDEGKKRDLNFDNLRLSFDGSYSPVPGEGTYYFSAQHRFYSFADTVHHAFMGYQFAPDHKVELGVTQVPFGLLPFASHSFWFGIGYYLGQEDDYDVGLKYYRRIGAWDLHAAYFLNEEYANAADLYRYSVDLARVDEQQNEERDQFNIRMAYRIDSDAGATELGLSGEMGAIDNLTTEKSGRRWAAAAHFSGHYGPWNPQLQFTRYDYSPENPAGIDNRLVRMGNLGSYRDVATEGTVISANLAYRFALDWGQFSGANCYNDYSVLLKDESRFNDSHINVTGCVFEGGPFWVWADIINGRNAWYLDDSSQFSGLGAGSEDDDWKTRVNINLEWYF
ncbi:MAG: hypothetical protein P8Y92_14100 [Halioglobus sp.]|jgi:hypothetical protein